MLASRQHPAAAPHRRLASSRVASPPPEGAVPFLCLQAAKLEHNALHVAGKFENGMVDVGEALVEEMEEQPLDPIMGMFMAVPVLMLAVFAMGVFLGRCFSGVSKKAGYSGYNDGDGFASAMHTPGYTPAGTPVQQRRRIFSSLENQIASVRVRLGSASEEERMSTHSLVADQTPPRQPTRSQPTHMRHSNLREHTTSLGGPGASPGGDSVVSMWSDLGQGRAVEDPYKVVTPMAEETVKLRGPISKVRGVRVAQGGMLIKEDDYAESSVIL